MLAPHMKNLAAGDQQLEVRTGSEKLHQARPCHHHLLEVVQHEQHLLLVQSGFQLLQRRSGVVALQAEGLRDGGKDQFGILKGGQ